MPEVVGGLTLPVDTADQAVCPIGQTNGQSSPLTISQAKQTFSGAALYTKPPINALQWSYRVCIALSQLKGTAKNCL